MFLAGIQEVQGSLDTRHKRSGMTKTYPQISTRTTLEDITTNHPEIW